MDVTKWWTRLLSSVALMATFTLMLAGNAPHVVASDQINSDAISAKTASAPNFNLTTHDGLISLKAHNASLKAIVEELGKELHIAVENKLPQDEVVNAEFEKLSVAEALKRLSRNYAYEADEKSGVVTKITLMPTDVGAATPTPTPTPTHSINAAEGSRDSESNTTQQAAVGEIDSSGPSFEFTFDPSTSAQDGDK